MLNQPVSESEVGSESSDGSYVASLVPPQILNMLWAPFWLSDGRPAEEQAIRHS